MALVGAASAAQAGAGPDALLSFGAAAAATEVGVAFVIDFGGSVPPAVGCVKVPTSDTGYDALSAFAVEEHWTPPVYNSAGLLCSIDGIPVSPACGQSEPGGYQYWSYWYMTDASGRWSYANRGASEAVGSARGGQDVEGWRFQNPGPDNPSAPAPRSSPDYASICASVNASSDTTTTAPSPSTTAPPAIPQPAPVTATTVPPTTAPPREVVSTTTSTLIAPPTTSAAAHAESRSALAAAPAATGGSGGGSATPLVVGGVLVLLLAVGAVVGWRRRSTP